MTMLCTWHKLKQNIYADLRINCQFDQTCHVGYFHLWQLLHFKSIGPMYLTDVLTDVRGLFDYGSNALPPFCHSKRFSFSFYKILVTIQIFNEYIEHDVANLDVAYLYFSKVKLDLTELDLNSIVCLNEVEDIRFSTWKITLTLSAMFSNCGISKFCVF